jgi:oligoendopeptidase F
MPCDRITRLTLEAQARVFRLAERDFGLSKKRIAIDSGINYETIRSYAGTKEAQAVMSLPSFIKLCGVIPNELLSQLLELADRHLEMDEEDEDTEFDDLADHGDNLARLVRQARHPNSPGGTEIIATEEEGIRAAMNKYGRKKARLQVVAA